MYSMTYELINFFHTVDLVFVIYNNFEKKIQHAHSNYYIFPYFFISFSKVLNFLYVFCSVIFTKCHQQ